MVYITIVVAHWNIITAGSITLRVKKAAVGNNQLTYHSQNSEMYSS